MFSCPYNNLHVPRVATFLNLLLDCLVVRVAMDNIHLVISFVLCQIQLWANKQVKFQTLSIYVCNTISIYWVFIYKYISPNWLILGLKGARCWQFCAARVVVWEEPSDGVAAVCQLCKDRESAATVTKPGATSTKDWVITRGNTTRNHTLIVSRFVKCLSERLHICLRLLLCVRDPVVFLIRDPFSERLPVCLIDL